MIDVDGFSRSFDDLADELDAAVAPEPSIRRRGAGTSKSSEPASVMRVVERDGVLLIDDAEPTTRGSARRSGGASADTGDVKYERAFERLDRSQIVGWLESLDRKLTPERGLRILTDDGLEPLATVPEQGRILLFIHGTFSESESFFNGIQENPLGPEFTDWARGKYSHVLTFDHPTLSVSPILNARSLAIQLTGCDAEIDVICHSRGGLVTRWWLEVFDRAPPDKRRAVFVGSPLAGTGLASPANIRSSLSLLSNIGSALGAATAGVPFLTVLTGVFRVVTSVTKLAANTPAVDAAIGLVPGLAAQSRVGNNRELLSLRQVAGMSPDRYFAVTSNFESEQVGWEFWKYFRKIGARAKDVAADLVFDGHNDLVVDSGSMVDLSDDLYIPGAQVLNFGPTDEVHHTNYFTQPRTLEFIQEMLSNRSSSPAPDSAKSGGIARSRGLSQRHGSSSSGRASRGGERGGSGPTSSGPRGGSTRRGGGTGRRGGRAPEQQQQQQQQQQMSAPWVRRELRRTPHLDLEPEEEAGPGDIVRVRVYADAEPPRAGEESEEIVVELPAGVSSIEIDTHLIVSPQLEVLGDALRRLEIGVDRDVSPVVEFEVRIRSRDEILAVVRELPSVKRASISAVFNYQGRPSGSVTRLMSLNLDLDVPESAEVNERMAVGTLRVEPEAERPDLTVQVRAQPINDGRQFQCWVSTPLIEAEEEERWEDWNLPSSAESIVRGYMGNFVDEAASSLERLASLKGSGRQLFDAAPECFKSVYWRLVDAGLPPKTLSVVSDEPYIPWELMIPHRRHQGRSESRQPLGVDCSVARWVLGDGCAGPQQLPLSDSIVIAPVYHGSRALPHAEEEARYVLEHFPGIRIEPVQLERIDEVLASVRGSILHLSCHGVDPAESPAQAIYLENDRMLDTTMLTGLDNLRAALEEKPTLVVINACEVGRPKPALVGLGGFAQTFIDLGAAGVVAALWSVRDDLAHQVAMALYRGILENPSRPFSDVLRELRARAYDRRAGAEDTYAAYCYYGDPLARAMG